MRLFTYLSYKAAVFVWLLINQIFLLAGIFLSVSLVRDKINLLEIAAIVLSLPELLAKSGQEAVNHT